jgi:nucleotide-binding universal stress UspA family protein
MSLFKNILCPINFDDASAIEIENARAAAMFFDAKLYLLHVATILSLAQEVQFKGGQAWTAQQVEEKLAEMARQGLSGLQYEVLTSDTPTGFAADAIVAAGERVGADLIILATHGRHGLAHLMLGSVAGQIVHKAQCPVLTVRLGGRNFAKPKAILCPISLADDSSVTLNLAKEAARTIGATVKLIHIIEQIGVHTSASAVGSKGAAEVTEKLQELGSLSLAGCLYETEVIFGHAAEELIAAASDEQITLVIMGTQSRTVPGRLFLGSVAERVVREAACPVITTRSVNT